MSVLKKNSAIRSICLYCKSRSDLDAEFHDIFDESNLELQLPTLVRQFFGIKVEFKRRNRQLLCQDCVNRLIELYDLEEHSKEATATGKHVNSDNSPSEADQEKDNDIRISINSPTETDRCSRNESPSVDVSQEQQNHQIKLSTSFDYLVEGTGEILNNVDEKAKQIYHLTKSTEEIFNVDDETVSTLYKPVVVYEQEIVNESDINYGEPEFAEDNLDTASSSAPYEHTDYETEDYVEIAAAEDLSNVSLDEIIDRETQIKNESLLYLDCTGADQKAENEVYEEVIIMENNEFQERENEYLHIENVSEVPTGVYNECSQKSLSNAISAEVDDNSMDAIEQNSLQSRDLVEEYLIEEIIGCEEYDNIDLNEYLDNALITNFEDLQLKWIVECKLCLNKHYSFQELIKHSCLSDEQIGEGLCSCIINDCNEVFDNFKSLSRHLIIKHYNNVGSVAIYGRCQDCQKSFSSIIDFNKHSCCKFKRKVGSRNYCQSCNLDFQSLKRYVFHMQFHLTKHRPKVCVLCAARFNNTDDFFDHVHYSHEPDTAMACIECDRFFKEISVFEKHMLCHESKYEFKCRHCPKKYTNRSGLTSHMDIYHNHAMKPLQCECCYKEFVNQSSYRSHMKIHMPEAKVPAYICSVCGLISNSADIIQTHLETDEALLGLTGEIIEKIVSAAYTCECCSIDFFSAQYLQHHRKSAKHNEKIFYCPLCQKAFKTLKHMRNHMTCHKDYDEWLIEFPIERLYMCNIGDCQDSYPLWSSLYYHKKRHKNIEVSGDPLKCQFCEKVCGTKMSLAIHVARSHNNDNVKCQHCHKSYKNEKDLKKHIEHIHVSTQCSKCRRVFKNRRNLISHEQLVHKNVKRYFCSHCKKGYYYKSELQAHEKNVHPDTSYKCQLCTFITNYPKSLDIHHMAKHTEDVPFKCTYCSKGFARKQLLSLHLKRHSADKDFICNEYCEGGCNASLITHFLLKKHIEDKHPSKDMRKGINAKRKAKDQEDELIIIHDDTDCEVEFVLGEDDGEYEVYYEHDNDDDGIELDPTIMGEELEDGHEDYAEMEA